MRNLKLDVIKIYNLPIKEDNIVKCININNKYFILIHNTVHLVDEDNDIVIKSDINTINWVPVENILYMSNGYAFYCYNVETEEINVIDIPEGYLIHEWNPSQDRIALIDNEGILKIVLLDAYNCHCTYIGKYQLECIENSPFINIGWGSQTTQFRGSEGKYSQKKISAEVSSFNEDNSLRIAWRDDGDIFAVSFVRDGQRLFKIFSCECEFLYESEYKPELNAELAWKPDGSVIATESRSSNDRRIMFFEKNGLYRYNFKLYSDKEVKKIEWNPAGDILMIWQKSMDNSEISFWTCSNFKWYLKQNLVFDKNNFVNYVQWKDKKWLEVITSKNIILYSWKWVTLINNNENRQDDVGAVLVVDGNVLRVTATSAHIVPPPYSSYNIKFSGPINNVAFGSTQNTVAVILDDYTLEILQLTKSGYKQQFTANISNGSLPLTLNNFVYDDKLSNIYCVQTLVDEHSKVMKFEMNSTKRDILLVKSCEFVENVYDLLYMCHKDNSEYCLGVCTKSYIKLFCPDTLSALPDSNLPVVEDEMAEEGGYYSIFYVTNSIFSLFLNSQRMYYNGKKIANNITSYLLCHGYLLFTTTENKLLCIKLSENGLNNLQANNLSAVYTRSIPSGAILINAVPRSRKIILQVPRGELEIINPRILAIDEIDKLMANKKHLEAFLIMRTDRINLNLMYDLNPSRFINDIEDFIKNVNNCEYLDVFLTQLQNSNISENLYRNCFENILNEEGNNKLITVASIFIESMKKIDNDYYLQSIVTAYLCTGTDDDLEKALKELSAAREREGNGQKLRVPVDNTLEHLIMLSSVEKLYDIALGMDQIELIMWVASKSQLDPLEYIPFLRELVSMETNYRNYKINSHIKRFEKAFTFLIQCDDVLDELKQLVTKNNLYKVILKYVLPTNQWYKPLLHLYACFLQKEGQYKESGLLFMKTEDYETALQCFVKGCCMHEALIAIKFLESNKIKINVSLEELAKKLCDDKQYQNASFIYDTILHNYEQAIAVLITGCLWSDALYLAYKNNRHDIIESEINPAILNSIENLAGNLKMYHNEFLTLRCRLQAIRNEKIKEIKENGEIMESGEYMNINEYSGTNFDLESVVSTTYSKTTSQRTKNSQTTSASSKRKKKIEKKVMQIRKGSAFENIAIIRRLYIIITEVENLANTVRDTCLQLMLHSEHYDHTFQLHSAYEELLILIESSRDIIWPQEMILPTHPLTFESLVYRLNLQHLEMQYRFPPKEMNNKWKIYSL